MQSPFLISAVVAMLFVLEGANIKEKFEERSGEKWREAAVESGSMQLGKVVSDTLAKQECR